MLIILITSVIILNSQCLFSYKLSIKKSKVDTVANNNWINNNMRRLFITSLNGKITAADVLKNPAWPGIKTINDYNINFNLTNLIKYFILKFIILHTPRNINVLM